MEGTESNSDSCWWDSHIGGENSKWLAENLEWVDQRIKQMLNLIEEDGSSSAMKAEIYYRKKPELIAHVEEFYRMHQVLAERYDHLTGELCKNISSLLRMRHSAVSDSSYHQASPLSTPDQKLGLHKSNQAIGFDLYLSSSGGRSDSSFKEAYESSSSFSPDSESEPFFSSISKSLAPLVKGDSKGLNKKLLGIDAITMEEKFQLTKQKNGDAALMEGEIRDYPMLHGRITESEEEQRVADKKVQSSEEEITRFKGELEKNQSVIVLMGDLQAEIQMKEADLEMEKRKVLELQKQVSELENKVLDSNGIIRTLQNELDINKEKLKDAEEEIACLNHDVSNKNSECGHQLQGQLESTQKDIALLEAKLDSEKSNVLHLQERILRYVANLSDRDNEISELKATFFDAQKNFFLEKAQLQSDIASLSEQQVLLEAGIEEWKLLNKSLENETWRCETEKMEMKGLHEVQEISWQYDNERLVVELSEKNELIEALNKNIDLLKLKYDMLMTEKDVVSAKANTLGVEVCSREYQIQQMDDHLCQLHSEHVELIAASESLRKLTDELRLRVDELEKEVDRQRVVISDREEGKREAIRQLCFSLDHYRSGYQELCQAYKGHNRHAVLAL
ncbi:unnamed protein product [Ilex paraguariensis]|uniref:NAB domain-containing protein n=1 Tax=Ilex paraguariensis TaxID=185542 RepID=A0ABC8QTU1_9AQUA